MHATVPQAGYSPSEAQHLSPGLPLSLQTSWSYRLGSARICFATLRNNRAPFAFTKFFFAIVPFLLSRQSPVFSLSQICCAHASLVARQTITVVSFCKSSPKKTTHSPK